MSRLPLGDTVARYREQSLISLRWHRIAQLSWVVAGLIVAAPGPWAATLESVGSYLQLRLSDLGLIVAQPLIAIAFGCWATVALSTRFSILGQATLTLVVLLYPVGWMWVLFWGFGKTKTDPIELEIPKARSGLASRPRVLSLRISGPLQTSMAMLIVFSESNSPTASLVLLISGLLVSTVAFTKVFHQAVPVRPARLSMIVRLLIIAFPFGISHLSKHSFTASDATQVSRSLDIVNWLSTKTRRVLAQVRRHTGSFRRHGWATLLATLDTVRWSIVLLFGGAAAWAGLLGLVSSGCDLSLGAWFQTATTTFLPGAETAPCVPGWWRVVIATTFWLAISLLIAPAVATQRDRQLAFRRLLKRLGPFIAAIHSGHVKHHHKLQSWQDVVAKVAQAASQGTGEDG